MAGYLFKWTVFIFCLITYVFHNIVDFFKHIGIFFPVALWERMAIFQWGNVLNGLKNQILEIESIANREQPEYQFLNCT